MNETGGRYRSRYAAEERSEPRSLDASLKT